MSSIRLTNLLLLVLSVFMGIIALRPLFHPLVAYGQRSLPKYLDAQVPLTIAALPIKGNTNPTNQTLGYVLLDNATGEIWAYPVGTAATITSTGPTYGNAVLIGTLTAGQSIH